jgi:hypothetical protein
MGQRAGSIDGVFNQVEGLTEKWNSTNEDESEMVVTQYAFGELDDEGKRNLSEFAALIEHRSSFEFMPAENRVYFTRKA